jgi:tricarballylate dehydrogenase
MTDVVVIGGGNAGLTAALSARENGANVIVFEAAEEADYGSDSFFSGGLFRVAYQQFSELSAIVDDLTLPGEGMEDFAQYDEAEFLDDWGRVTGYRLDPEISEYVVDHSFEALQWLHEVGRVPFISPLVVDAQGHLRHSRPGWHGGFVEASGAGVGLTTALLKSVKASGAEIRFGWEVIGLRRRSGASGWTVTARGRDGSEIDLDADALIVASGGFQADPEWRARDLGVGWDLAKIRGSVNNTGKGLRLMMDHGAKAVGNWSGCHAVAWSTGSGDAGRPDANHVFERESHPFGISINSAGERFLDEGEDFGAYTYAKYGKVILTQPGQVAWQIFDDKTPSLWTDEYRYKNPEAARTQADTLEELADKLVPRGMASKELFLKTVADYNGSIDDSIEFNPYTKDGKRTKGLSPDKTNWSQRIDTGPFYAFEVTCGITFTFGGVKVDTGARVLDRTNRPIPDLYAIGEVVGGLYYFNYASGTGLTAGAVLGREAGKLAAAG